MGQALELAVPAQHAQEQQGSCVQAGALGAQLATRGGVGKHTRGLLSDVRHPKPRPQVQVTVALFTQGRAHLEARHLTARRVPVFAAAAPVQDSRGIAPARP